MATKLAATSEAFLAAAIAALDSDVLSYTGGAASGDKIRMCKMQKGTRIEDIQVITDAANAAATLSAGWEYTDGSSNAPTEYINAGSVAAAARLRATSTVVPTVLAKDAYLILTVGGAAISAGTNVYAIPQAKYLGTS